MRVNQAVLPARYKLREFTAQYLDGNRLRVFFDLGSSGA